VDALERRMEANAPYLKLVGVLHREASGDQ
jgi:hypothetical protein